MRARREVFHAAITSWSIAFDRVGLAYQFEDSAGIEARIAESKVFVHERYERHSRVVWAHRNGFANMFDYNGACDLLIARIGRNRVRWMRRRRRVLSQPGVTPEVHEAFRITSMMITMVGDMGLQVIALSRVIARQLRFVISGDGRPLEFQDSTSAAMLDDIAENSAMLNHIIIGARIVLSDIESVFAHDPISMENRVSVSRPPEGSEDESGDGDEADAEEDGDASDASDASDTSDASDDDSSDEDV